MVINNAGVDVKIVFSTEEIDKNGCGFVQQDENTRAYFISINVWELMQKNRSVRKLLNSLICTELSTSESDTGRIVKNSNFGSSINIVDRNGSQEYSFKLCGLINENKQISCSYPCELSTYETMIVNNYIKNIDACIKNGDYQKAQRVFYKP